MDGKHTQYIVTPWVICTLIVGIALSLYVSYRVQSDNALRIEQSVKAASDRIMDDVVSRIRLYQYGLRGARGAVITAGQAEVSRDAFRRYSLTRDIDEEFPGARGFGFIRRVPFDQETRFTAVARQEGRTNFEVKTLFSDFSERYIIQYIEPELTNQEAIGFDIATEKNRREAATASLYSGEVRLTGPITLVQASGKPQQSFLILMPIYSGGSTPTSQAERIKTGFGWSFAPLLMEDVLKGLAIDPEKVRFSLLDITNRNEQVLFYDSGTFIESQYDYKQSTWIFGRQWQSTFSVSPTFITELHLPDPILFLVQGLILSMMATLLVVAVHIGMARKREVVAYQSKIAAIVEGSADGIFSKNLKGEITSWNKGAETIFGYTEQEVIGKTVLDLLVPDSLKTENESSIAQVKQSKQALSLETRRTTKFGTQVPVSVMFSPIFGANNKVTGISQSVRDISQQKKTEAQIQQLNTNLENQVKERTVELEELNLLLNEVLYASSEVSIIATDTKGNIKLFNRGAEKMLQYSAKDVIGKVSPASFHCEAEIEQHRKRIYEETGKVISSSINVLAFNALRHDYDCQEWRYVDKHGHSRPVSLVITPMKNADQDVIGFLGIAMDISEQKNNQHALTYARDQLLMAADVARLGIWSYDIETRCLEWNDLMFDLYQYPKEKRETGLVYDDWIDRVHPEDKEIAAAALKNALAGEACFDIVFRLVLPDGGVRFILASAFLRKSIEGKLTKVMGINRDITQERELESWLRKAKEEADAASAAKSSFLANMSHEIRTPMNAILGMLHLVNRTPLTPQQSDYISKAHISAQSLLGLINDVLDFSKVDAGKLELENAPFDVSSLLSELSTVLSAGLTEKDVELIFDIDQALPACLLGDRLRLLQVLMNLLSNAIKFTSKGNVVLQIKQTHLQNNVASLRVSVKDTGIGIAAEQLESIFDVFSQAESSTTRRFGGSGLGLVICRRFVALMGGTLEVESTLGVGSHFYFHIDLPVAAFQSEEESTLGLRKSIKVLVVDSHLATQAMLVRMAKRLGWKCDRSESIAQAIVLLRQAAKNEQWYDVVLLDDKLIDFDGQQSIDQLRGTFHSHDKANLVVLSNRRNSASLQSNPTSWHGISDHLFKPITLSRLSESVYQSLSTVSARTASSHGVLERPEKDVGRLRDVSILLVEDNEFNQQIASELLIAEGAQVTLAKSGLEGVSTVFAQGEKAFDVVLMDVQMPGMDGLEATRQIRQAKQFDVLPILAMTANVSPADRAMCLDAGMNDHIGKPLDIEQMNQCILNALRFSKERPLKEALDHKEPQSTGSQNRTEDAFNTLRCEAPDSMLERLGNSVELFDAVIEAFTEESRSLVEALNQSITAEDFSNVKEHLHSLKGASLTAGLVGVSEQLAQWGSKLKTAQTDNEKKQGVAEVSVELFDYDLQTQIDNDLAFITEQVRKAL
ncbi:PAS domain-containing hybrid sensor histidine kinase/response regulator [Marinomonas algarum]|uniref:Sensory/regulatory protein RpfC n=1 Tax=Marinomonas algarum TaxID=2883105 RepID=A0A9X1LDE2_9GAMM|nr:PAS domain S-box protein [Marinomonas algarum]MCB5162432.1 PAS domain S-box protein [Marinomonas algarum]